MDRVCLIGRIRLRVNWNNRWLNVRLRTIWDNLKFTRNGRIKAWHDDCELTYDGLKKKEVVHMTFIDFMIYEYLNETESWTYISEPYTPGGYGTKVEQYMGALTQQGMKYFSGELLDARKIGKLANWLVRNVFSIAGII